MEMPVNQVVDSGLSTDQIYDLIRSRIRPHLGELSRCRSTEDLLQSPVYQSIKPTVDIALKTPEIGSYSKSTSPAKSRYRIVAYNVERGIQLAGQIETFRSHPYLKECDVMLLTETDVGMARSGNRAVAQELARELHMHFAFVPCYLNLAKGSGVEYDVGGENDLGLHGNAILSRYPIRKAWPIHLQNGKDKMKGREKRLGVQTALAADIDFPNYPVTVASVHLDANSTQRHRHDQMKEVIDNVDANRHVIIGGDWNTSTYDSSRAFHSIMGFWLRVFMGVDNVIRNHYLHPYNRFEKELFQMIESRGFDYRNCNRLGERTSSYDVDCPKTRKNLGEWVPAFCFPFIRWALRNHGGYCPIKIDWFAVRGAACENPVIIHELREGRSVPLSDHDPIGVDLIVPEEAGGA